MYQPGADQEEMAEEMVDAPVITGACSRKRKERVRKQAQKREERHHFGGVSVLGWSERVVSMEEMEMMPMMKEHWYSKGG